MRQAMICVSVMLALVQLWPVVFGHRLQATMPALAAETKLAAASPASSQSVPAVAVVPVSKALPVTGKANPIGCYQRYQIAYRACSPSDGGCRMAAADRWDLCEATGMWQE